MRFVSPLQESSAEDEEQGLRFPSPLVFRIPGSRPRNYVRARSATVGVVEEEVALAKAVVLPAESGRNFLFCQLYLWYFSFKHIQTKLFGDIIMHELLLLLLNICSSSLIKNVCSCQCRLLIYLISCVDFYCNTYPLNCQTALLCQMYLQHFTTFFNLVLWLFRR